MAISVSAKAWKRMLAARPSSTRSLCRTWMRHGLRKFSYRPWTMWGGIGRKGSTRTYMSILLSVTRQNGRISPDAPPKQSFRSLPSISLAVCCSSTTRESLRNFSQSVTTFFRCYVQTMPVARVKNFLTLLMEAIRKRSIGTTGTLHAVLSAFGDTGTKVPAMGRDLLLQLKETLLVILPPLNQVSARPKSTIYHFQVAIDTNPGRNAVIVPRSSDSLHTLFAQAKRELLLDGVMGILGAFTDFEELSLLWSVPDPQTDGGGYRNTKGCGLCESDRLPPVFSLVTSIFSAIPADLAMTRYMSHLADWVSNMPLKVNGASDMQYGEKHVLWLDMFKDCVKTCLTRTDIDTTESTGDADAEGRNLCLLGMVLSQGFAFQENRQQVHFACGHLTCCVSIMWHLFGCRSEKPHQTHVSRSCYVFWSRY